MPHKELSKSSDNKVSKDVHYPTFSWDLMIAKQGVTLSETNTGGYNLLWLYKCDDISILDINMF